MRYLFGPGKTNEHTDQRVITSGIVMGVEEGRMLSASEIADAGAALDAANEVYGTNPSGGHIWHLSLSQPAGDRHLSDEAWAEIAHKVAEAIGFEKAGLEPAAWVAVGHGTSAAGNQHIHIAASLVRGDGRCVNLWQSRKMLSRVCNEIEHDYGLVVVEGREGRGMPGLSRAELERTEREQRAEPPRVTLARHAREAMIASTNEAEFVDRLRAVGVLVRPRFEAGGRDVVVGYSVALRGDGDDKPIWFGGGKLARDLTLPMLRQFWEQSPAERQGAAFAWKAEAGPEAERRTEVDWGQVATDAQVLADTLAAVPITDVMAWREAANGAAGVFAAWSRRFEGDQPGPMAATADALARSAQVARGETRPTGEATGAFRGMARVFARASLKSDSPLAWAMLIHQMGRTLRSISAAAAARGEAALAKELAGRLAGELGELHDRFGGESVRELVPTAGGEEERAGGDQGPPVARSHRKGDPTVAKPKSRRHGRGGEPRRGIGR